MKTSLQKQTHDEMLDYDATTLKKKHLKKTSCLR